MNILLGKPDAARMTELMDLLKSSKDSQEKVNYLEEMEGLVENLDNANDLEPLGLWGPLISFLQDDDGEVRSHTAWALGTAVQNNEKSQHAFLKHEGLGQVVKLLKDQDLKVVSKSLYCISGLINNFHLGLNKFIELNGFQQLAQVLQMGDLNSCRKILFMLSSLFGNQNTLETHEAALSANIGIMVVSLLESDDLDVTEKALSVLTEWESRHPGTVKYFINLEADYSIRDQELKESFQKLRSKLI